MSRWQKKFCSLCSCQIPSRLWNSAVSFRRENVRYVGCSERLGVIIDQDLSVVDDFQTFLFSRTAHHVEDVYVNLFSVLPRSAPLSIKNRVVVAHTGRDDGDGEWKCYKDSKGLDCLHIVDARHTLQKYLHGDPKASDPNATHGALQGARSKLSSFFSHTK